MAPAAADDEDEVYYVEDDPLPRSKMNPIELPTCVVCIETLGMHGGPASLPCGHNGCLECLQKVQRHSTMPLCPLCRKAFDKEMNLGSNLELKEALEQARVAASRRRNGRKEEWVPVSATSQVSKESYPGSKLLDHIKGYGSPQQPELNLWNVVSGLFTIITRVARPKDVANTGNGHGWTSVSDELDRPFGDEAGDQAWNSVLLPSAPPLYTDASGDVRAVRAVLEAEPPQWLPDSAAFVCMQCAASFRPLTCGRHHCRFCGGIFCRSCSRGRCLMPVKFREREPQRVCDPCYERLEPVQRILADRVSNSSQVATHDVTDFSCMRSWLNSPLGLSMEQEIYKATNALRSYAKIGVLKPERAIPDAVLRDAKGLAIITIMKAGFMVTYKIGTGLVIARQSDGAWSAPSAIASAGLGWGAQVGGELTDFIIVLHSTEAVKAFSGRIHICFGAGLSAAAGPVGRIAEADLRAGDGGTAACYTYSLSKGAFVGVSLEGSVVTRRSDTNARFYGDPYITSADILSGVCPPPRAAAPLYQALHDLFHRKWVD